MRPGTVLKATQVILVTVLAIARVSSTAILTSYSDGESTIGNHGLRARFLSTKNETMGAQHLVLVKETLNLLLAFPQSLSYSHVEVARNLHNHELDIFAKLTRSYLRAREVALVSLEPQGQHWRNYHHVQQQQQQDDKEAHGNNTEHRATVLVHDRAETAGSTAAMEHSATGLDPATPVWTINMTIEAYNAKDIPFLIEEDGTTYLNVLAVGLDHVFLDHSATGTTGQTEQGDSLAWMLSSLTLSLSLLLAVLIVRCSSSGRRRKQQEEQQRRHAASSTEVVGDLPRIPYPLWLHRQWRHQPMKEGKNHHNPIVIDHQTNIMEFNSDVEEQRQDYSAMSYDLNSGVEEEEEVLSCNLGDDSFLDSSTTTTTTREYPKLPPNLAPTGSLKNGTLDSVAASLSNVGVVLVPSSSGILSMESNIIVPLSSCDSSPQPLSPDDKVLDEQRELEEATAETGGSMKQEVRIQSDPPITTTATPPSTPTVPTPPSSPMSSSPSSLTKKDQDDAASTLLTSDDGEILVRGTLVFI